MSEIATTNGVKTSSHLEESDVVPKEESASSESLKPLAERSTINEKTLDSPSSETRLPKPSSKSQKKRRVAPAAVLSLVSAHVSRYPLSHLKLPL